jgi:hypothetical protein
VRNVSQIAASQLITVRNGTYGQAHHMATGISPASAPAGRDPCGGGFSGLRRARSSHRSQDTLARHEITRIRRFAGGGARNPAISQPGMQLPLRDNTLHAIPPRPETKKSSPGDHHSRPPGIRSSRSSVTV